MGTRERLTREAARLFAERGFHGTSVEDLGAACGISGPAVYKHFAGKHALLAHVLTSISEQLLAGGREVLAAGGGLPGLVASHADFALSRPDLIRVQDRDLASLHEQDRRRVRRLQRSYVELWVDQLVDLDPALAPEQARVRAHAAFGLLNSTPHSARGRVDARPELVRMALAALGQDVRAG